MKRTNLTSGTRAAAHNPFLPLVLTQSTILFPSHMYLRTTQYQSRLPESSPSPNSSDCSLGFAEVPISQKPVPWLSGSVEGGSPIPSRLIHDCGYLKVTATQRLGQQQQCGWTSGLTCTTDLEDCFPKKRQQTEVVSVLRNTKYTMLEQNSCSLRLKANDNLISPQSCGFLPSPE